MKKKMIVIALMFFSVPGGVSLWAQNMSRAERLNAQKVAFITERLHLTPDEAQNFWPVYNEYRQKKMKIEQKKAALMRNYSENSTSLTDKEAGQIADDYVNLEKEQADLLVQYNVKFKKVLPPRKVLLLYKAEKQFTAYLLRQIRDRQRKEGPPPKKF